MNPDANLPPYANRRASGPLAGLLILVFLATCVPLVSRATADPAAADTLIDVDGLLQAAEASLQDRDLAGAARAFTAAADVSPDAAIAERATQYNFGAGFDAYAEQSARRWAALAPGNPLPRELLGRLLLRRHAVDEAVPEFLAALGPNEPRRDEVYLALASDLSGENDARLVTRTLSRLTALDPLAPGLQLALGSAALRSGDYALARGAGQLAAADDPDWPEAQLLMARGLAGEGRLDEALGKVQGLAASNPNPLIELEYARMLADAGQMADARAKLADLTERFGDRAEISRTLAFMDLAEGDLDAAGQRLQSLEDTGADRFEAFYYLGQIASRRGDAEEARRSYGRISSGPYLLPAQLAIADSYAKGGAPEEGVRQLERFAGDHPAQAFDVLGYRAHLLQVLDRPEEALAVYAEALEYKPASIAILMARGGLLEELGRVDAALADLRKAASIAPDDAAALNAFGYILANRTRQTRTAWRYVRRAWELEPDSAPVEDSVGWTLFKLGRKEEARNHLEAALARMPDPEIASHLAEVSWALGDKDRARELLSSAAANFPDSKPVRDTTERLLK